MTQGQLEIFADVIDPSISRLGIRTITQYGKSDVVSMGLITIATRRAEKILIVAPSEKQAGIIMGYIIQHLFDHPYLTALLDYEGSLERLREERSKKRITLKTGAEIFILTAEADTLSKEGKSLMGFGATIVIVDESSLIPDEIFSKILRMVGGVPNGKLIQIGNPFYRNHFYKAFNQERYKKVVIKKEQALLEGRITQLFLDEARENMTPLDFKIFYDNEFPEGGAEDSLIPWEWITLAVEQKDIIAEGNQAGLDVARFGRDKSVYVYQKNGYVPTIEMIQDIDTMRLVGWVRPIFDKDSPDNMNIDVIGIGSGVYDRLYELNYSVSDINVGESPTSDQAKGKFLNLRAEMYWNLREQFRPDNRNKSSISIPNDVQLIQELQELRYKYSSERKIRIEDKEEMKKRIGRSPDKADALGLAFFKGEEVGMSIL